MKNEQIPKYEIIIYWDNDDKIFIAEVSELAGCAAHGKTQIDAVKNVTKQLNSGLKRRGNSATKFPNLADTD